MTATYSLNIPGKRIDGSRFLEVANDLFVYRKFKDVLQMCRVVGIDQQNAAANGNAMEIVLPQTVDFNRADAEQGEMINDEEPTQLFQRRIFNESLCILAIQAFAETDQWDRVDPFLKQYYETQARYPISIVKLWVHNFPSAENLAVSWLSDGHNQTLDQYSVIVELLINLVLLPQAKMGEAKTLVQLNAGLGPEKKIAILKYLEKVEEEWTMNEKEILKENSNYDSSGSTLMHLVQRLRHLLTKLLPMKGLRCLRDITCLGFFIYLIVLRTNLDLSSHVSNVTVLWSGIVRIWRSLFSPFHLMPTT